MEDKPKPVSVIFLKNYILMECPFCGRTLIRTDYNKITKLLEKTEVPRGKICEKCGHTVILKLKSADRQTLKSKLFVEKQAKKENNRV